MCCYQEMIIIGRKKKIILLINQFRILSQLLRKQHLIAQYKSQKYFILENVSKLMHLTIANIMFNLLVI